jgi:hypothetical protein
MCRKFNPLLSLVFASASCNKPTTKKNNLIAALSYLARFISDEQRAHQRLQKHPCTSPRLCRCMQVDEGSGCKGDIRAEA